MAKIFLRDYNREIERLIDGGHNDEAIAHCRYILQSFPKNVETYRLLGKALLESQRYGDAADILQRVLSSVPDDFIGHLGMSIIQEEKGDLNTALWHMERAFEVQPANNVIQEELRRLFNRRDGVEPARIQLTRGALARMYIKGDLHAQAIAELRAALAEDAERPDLQVMLARAYQRAGQRVEAAETASQLLIKLPYCLEANRILAEILVGTERASEAEIYRQRVIALDPYYAHLPPGARSSDQASDAAVSLERHVYQPGEPFPVAPPADREAGPMGGAAGEEELPAWLTGVEPETQQPEASQGEFEASEIAAAPQPSAGSTEIPTEPIPVARAASSTQIEPEGQPEDRPEGEPQDETEPASEFQPETPPAAPSEPVPMQDQIPGEMIPDWLRNAGWDTAGSETAGYRAAEPGGETPPAEEEAEVEGAALASAEIPDWLQALAPKETGQAETPSAAGETSLPWQEEEQAGEAGEDEDWLSAESGAPSTASGESEIPDWLQPAEEEPSETETPAGEPEAEISWPESQQAATPTGQELPDWLSGPSVEPPATPVDDANVWLPEDAQPVETAGEGETSSQEEPVEEPDWLRASSLEAAGPQAVSEEPPVEVYSTEIPSEEEPAADVPVVEEPGAAEEPIVEEPAAEEPDWLRTPAEEPGEAIPDWLRAASLEVPEPQSVSEEPAAAASTAETPSEEEPAVDEAAADELDWLRAASAEAAGPQAAPEEPAEEVPTVELHGADEEPVVEEPATEEPDWLRAAETQDFSEAPSAEQEPAKEEPIEQPDWLGSSRGETSAEQDIPEWLKSALGAVEEPSSEASPVEQAGSGDVPEELPVVEPPVVEPPVVEPPVVEPPVIEGDTKPVRVRKAEAAPEEPQVGAAETESAGSLLEEVPSEVLPEAAQEAPIEPPASGLEAGELPEWLGAAGEPGEGMQAESPVEAALEEPTTPQEFTAETEAAPALGKDEDTEPLPDWLRDMAGKFDQPSEALPSEAPISEAPSSEAVQPGAPEFTEETLAEPGSQAAEAKEETPDWLRDLAEKLDLPLTTAPSATETPSEEAPAAEILPGETAAAPTPSTPLDLNTANLSELENIPGVGFILAQRIIAQRETFGAFSSLEELAEIPGMTPDMVGHLSNWLAVAPAEAQPGAVAAPAETLSAPTEASVGVESGAAADPQTTLAQAWNALLSGDSDRALQQYSALIQTEQALEQVIHDLREATFRYPIDVSLYQALGDAYLRSGQLQEALDAYTKAEELLR